MPAPLNPALHPVPHRRASLAPRLRLPPVADARRASGLGRLSLALADALRRLSLHGDLAPNPKPNPNELAAPAAHRISIVEGSGRASTALGTGDAVSAGGRRGSGLPAALQAGGPTQEELGEGAWETRRSLPAHALLALPHTGAAIALGVVTTRNACFDVVLKA